MKTIIIFITIINMSAANAENFSVDSNKIFKNLRCLICQGQSVGDSNSEFAQTIKLVVQDLIDQGKSEKEIYNFLIEKYGDWIVYNPPLEPETYILWFGPFALIFIAILVIFIVRKRIIK